jgi:hypothetical protein
VTTFLCINNIDFLSTILLLEDASNDPYKGFSD